MKDSCPFYDDLDEILGASTIKLFLVVMQNEEEQDKGIILHPCVNSYNISTLSNHLDLASQ